MHADGKKGNHEDFRVIKSIFRKDSDAPPTRNVPPQSQPESRPQWFNQVSTSPATNPWGSQRDHTNETNALAQSEPDSRHFGEGERPTANLLGNGVKKTYIACTGPAYEPLVPTHEWVTRAVPGVCQRPRRHGGDSPGGVDGSTFWLRMILNRPDASTKLAAPVFYFLGFAACFAATNARPFCFVAAALACFCAACFCVDFGDLSPICLNYHPWFGRREH